MFRNGAAGASRLDTDKTNVLETGTTPAPRAGNTALAERK